MKMIQWILCAVFWGGVVLGSSALAENEALYFPNGELYIPHANLLDYQGNVVHSYSANLHKFGRSWNFKLYGLSEVSIPPAQTNAVVSTNLVGTWDFSFNEINGLTYNGSAFGYTTNMAPISTNLTFTLTQTNNVVAATGTVNSVQYSLAGEIHEDFFAFTLLAGKTNSTVTLAVGQALLGDDAMEGDYFWSTANGAEVKTGTLSATKR